MGFIILTIIAFIVAVIIGIREYDMELSCCIFFLYILIIGAIFAIGLGSGQKIINTYEEKQYNIQGLENNIEIKQKMQGQFILGFGSVSSKTEQEMKYYYFKSSKKGKQLKSVKASNVYIRETDKQKPCLIKEYEEKEFTGFFKFMFGTCNNKVEKNKILVVPTNTIKIEYNVDI